MGLELITLWTAGFEQNQHRSLYDSLFRPLTFYTLNDYKKIAENMKTKCLEVYIFARCAKCSISSE